MQLDTVTFWHQPVTGGVKLASSCVGPAPLDVRAAHDYAQRATSYGPLIGMSRATLTFPPPATADPVREVKQVMAAYSGCARCHLCEGRMKIVHCRGNAHASVVFLGEGPGKDENDCGAPFVGRSGKLQEEMCRAVSIDPESHIFWMNVLGCRAGPHWGDDRAPTMGELVACSEHTYLLLQAVRPRVVVCLGKVATRYFFDEPPAVWSFTRFVPQGSPDDWIMVGYAHHPAYLVRVIGVPSMYKEYAAQRTYYSTLAQQMGGLQKVSRWLFLPRYLSRATSPLLAWPDRKEEPQDEDEVPEAPEA